MSQAVVYGQPAFILQHRPYRESSVLLDVLTESHGVITVLAKGVRKPKSKTAALLQPFTRLTLSYWDKTELKVLNQVEWSEAYALQRLALYCGFYLNELVLSVLHKHDPHPEVFSCYCTGLQALSQSEFPEQTLRYFELDLLQAIGYGLDLTFDYSSGAAVNPQMRYRFVAGQGLQRHDNGIISGHSLWQLQQRAVLEGDAMREAKHLLRSMLEVQLQGRRLKSREVLAALMQYV
jgi:DNA repair protein RecO (recombination protein O)